jgi:sugar phosphate isomerase/epimerase
MKKHYLISMVALILLLDDSAMAQKAKPLYTAALGMAPYTFRRSFPNSVAATLDTIKLMGFTEIEGGGGRGMTPEEYKKLCDERGISIPSFGAGYEQLARGKQSIDSIISRAKIFGAKYVMCSWIPHKDGVLTIDDAKKAVNDFNAAGKLLKQGGITLCYHAHGYEFQPYEDGTLLDYIFKNTKPEYVSFEMDIFWIWFGGGDPVSLLKKYGNRWKLMHLKDMKKGTPKDLTGSTSGDSNVPLGQGELDIPAIIREANKVGIKHFFIEDESDRIITQVPQSVIYLKSLRE